jgi:acetate kinase
MEWCHRALESLIYKKSGLLGVSGISSDMRSLRGSDDPKARGSDRPVHLPHRPRDRLAVGGARRAGGPVFTGGIGQRDLRTRQEVVAGCAGWERTWTSSATQLVGLISSDYSDPNLGSADRRGRSLPGTRRRWSIACFPAFSDFS